jgi:hypothetical protein
VVARGQDDGAGVVGGTLQFIDYLGQLRNSPRAVNDLIVGTSFPFALPNPLSDVATLIGPRLWCDIVVHQVSRKLLLLVSLLLCCQYLTLMLHP